MRILTLISCVAILSLSGCDNAEFSGAKAEVKKTEVKLDLPSIPKFDMPATGGATHSVKEMRLMGKKHLKTKVKVKGFITWIYDCAIAGGKEPLKEEMTLKERKKYISENPQICWRPHFNLGDSPDTPPHESIWVVDVPRELRKDEKRNMEKEEIEALPPVPVYSLHHEVILTGTWDRRSPMGFANSEGLLVFEELENLSEPAEAEEDE